MKRRRALRLLGTASAAPLVAPGTGMAELLELGNEVRRGMSERGAPLETLSAEQARLVAAIADVIIPETDTPGAADAGVTEFIDTLLTGWLDEPERDAFVAGIEMVGEMARSDLGRELVEADREARIALVGRLDAAAFPADDSDGQARTDPIGPWFYDLKRFTLAGYFTSEVGMRTLGYRIVPGAFEGCVLLDQYGAGNGR